MSGRRSSNVDGMVSRNREFRHAKVTDRLDLETGRRHIDENGDRLLSHLTLALDLRLFRLGAEQKDSARATSSADAIAPANWALMRSSDSLVEVDRLLIDRRLRI